MSDATRFSRLFLAITHFQLPYNSFIMWEGSATFEIDLIHDHVYFQRFIWKDVYRLVLVGHHFGVAIIGLVVSMVIFIVCLAIESLRKKVIFIGRKYLKKKHEENHRGG
ncbi:MAG: hypothetical protein IC227_01200 [Enterococcus lacertideformus]|uniref:Uncharacterized protein n=1 Tax=Enterococcus lacertideformus TaxID=2771493 RepID=A0A931FB67_9ENTE|nr:hypothetical protein [Enterococcus lacertideformus]